MRRLEVIMMTVYTSNSSFSNVHDGKSILNASGNKRSGLSHFKGFLKITSD
jgi:hypothetical protein